jgi:hypothetical protein
MIPSSILKKAHGAKDLSSVPDKPQAADASAVIETGPFR